MGFRTLVISRRCKLDYKMGYLEMRAEETKKILISDLEMVIIENPAVSLTGVLLENLINEKVKVIFCDRKRNPQAELVPYYGSHDCSRKLKTQLEWDDEIKGEIWTAIVSEKIRKQAEFLEERNREKEGRLLRTYLTQLEFCDATNREGHSAKVYFNALFGKDFTRNDNVPVNAALNYGYSIILSAVNREVAANGYLTQLGLFHDNIYNQFNLSCDLMEPLRIIVDRFVCGHTYAQFGVEEKHELLQMMYLEVGIDNMKQYLPNAIKIYVKSVFDALNDRDSSRILFYTL